MSEQTIQKGGIIVMPRAPGSDTPEVRINLQKIYVVLGRVEEVAMVTSQKAPELMSAFNKAYLDLGKWASVVLYEKSQAKMELDKLYARIILEKAPAFLAEKKVRESDATRQAVADLDPEYQNAREVLDKLVALYEVLKHQMKSLEMAYTGAKKVLGEHNPNLIDQRKLLDGMDPTDEDSPFGVARG